MSVQCLTCGEDINAVPQMPFRTVPQNGTQVLVMDYSPVYEHIRDEHPDQWTDAMAEEFRQRVAEQSS